MHILCEQELLLYNMSMVSKAVSSKSTLPILEYVLLISDEKGLRMKGYDLQLGIETKNIECIQLEKGVIALKAKMFSDIIRKFPKGILEIIVKEKNITVIKNKKSKFEIIGQSSEDFPIIPSVEKKETLTLNSLNLKSMIKQTLFAVAQSESRPALTGENFDIKNKVLSVVAVDGFRIALAKTEILNEKEFNIIIPSRTLDEVSKIINDDENIDIHFTDSHILFNTSECKIISNLIEGDFIKYEQMFTDDYTTKITIDRLELLSALERTMLISNDGKRSPVKFKIDEEQLVITSNTEQGNCYEQLSIELEGDNLEIAFNPKYVVDAIKSVEEDKITMFYTTALSPCIIKGVKANKQKYLILPLRITE